MLECIGSPGIMVIRQLSIAIGRTSCPCRLETCATFPPQIWKSQRIKEVAVEIAIQAISLFLKRARLTGTTVRLTRYYQSLRSWQSAQASKAPWNLKRKKGQSSPFTTTKQRLL